MVGQFRHAAHQVEHCLTRGDHSARVLCGAHLEIVGPAIEEADLPHELRRPERGVEHALIGVGIDDLDLAFDDVNEGVHRIADLGNGLTLGEVFFLANFANGFDVRLVQRDAAHCLELLTDLFHSRVSC